MQTCSKVSWLIRRRQVEYFTAEWSLQIFSWCSFSSNSIPRREHFWSQSVVVHFSASQNRCLPGKVFSMSGWIETVIEKKSGSGLNWFWVFLGTLYTLGYIRVPYFLLGISRYLIYSQAEWEKVWSWLSAHLQPFFRLLGCILTIFVKKYRILTSRDKRESYLIVLQQNNV